MIVVSDGAGSAKNSRWGSKLAVKAFGEHVFGQLQGEFGARMKTALGGWVTDPSTTAKTLGTEFHYLFHKAGTLAIQAIETEAKTKGGQPQNIPRPFLRLQRTTTVTMYFLQPSGWAMGQLLPMAPVGRYGLWELPMAESSLDKHASSIGSHLLISHLLSVLALDVILTFRRFSL